MSSKLPACSMMHGGLEKSNDTPTKVALAHTSPTSHLAKCRQGALDKDAGLKVSLEVAQEIQAFASVRGEGSPPGVSSG